MKIDVFVSETISESMGSLIEAAWRVLFVVYLRSNLLFHLLGSLI